MKVTNFNQNEKLQKLDTYQSEFIILLYRHYTKINDFFTKLIY